MNADEIWARLGRDTFWHEISLLEEVGSTNDVAMQWGREGAEGGAAIFAERQTAGRGRFGRRWESAGQKGLWLSLLLRPEISLANWARLTTWAAVGLAEVLERVGGREARIKWPNDVELGRRKVAGILAEVGHDGHGRPFAVLGMGVNVNHAAEDFPAELADRATSLRMETGMEWDRTELAAELLRELAARWSGLADFGATLAKAAERSSVLGRRIEARCGEETLTGFAEGLDEEGCLRLRLDDGTVRKLSAGEVTLRPES